MDRKLVEATVNFLVKGGSVTIKDVLPNVSMDKDYFVQYFGVCKILANRVIELDAKKVLEFGTREGYSTRLFSIALEETNGKIHTVDINDPVNKAVFDEYVNIEFIKSSVEELDWKDSVDILYIDDWHDPWHLYYELNKFAHLAREVIIHDVMNELGTHLSLMRAIETWCAQNMMFFTFYPVNMCGCVIIHIEKSKEFYKNEN